MLQLVQQQRKLVFIVFVVEFATQNVLATLRTPSAESSLETEFVIS